MKGSISTLITGACLLFLPSSCTPPLEEYDLYPDLTWGEWEVLSIDFSRDDDGDSCDLEDIFIFGKDGRFERLRGACADTADLEVTGISWEFRPRRDQLLVKERFRMARGRARGTRYRRFEAAISNDTLWLEELWEEGNNRYRLERR